MYEFCRKYFLSIFFYGMIFLIPLIDFFSPDKIASIQENRTLAGAPHLGEKGYFAKMDDYLRDHFGLREIFIKVHHKIKFKFFKQENGLKAIFGKDLWAFYMGSIEHYEGKVKEHRINNFIQNIRNLRADFPHIPILVVVIPNKTFIYPEYLPDYVTPSRQRFETVKKLQVVQGLEVLDLYDTLKQKKDQSIFLKNDTHWTSLGAYFAYQEIIRFINTRLEWNLKIKDDIKEIKKEPYVGDLSKMLGQEDTFITEYSRVFFINTSAIAQEKDPGIIGSKIPDYFNPAGSKNLLLFHDSFAQHSLATDLAESFHTIKTFWSFNFKAYAKQIEEFQPDLILIEVVDRHIQM